MNLKHTFLSHVEVALQLAGQHFFLCFQVHAAELIQQNLIDLGTLLAYPEQHAPIVLGRSHEAPFLYSLHVLSSFLTQFGDFSERRE